MTLARVLGGVGRTFIAAGIIILLFVAYQLWGTGIQHARAQNALENDFTELLEQAPVELRASDLSVTPEADPPGSGATEGTAAEVDAVVEASDEGETPELTDEERLQLLYREEGQAIARMSIPRIGVDEFVVEGVRVDDLRKGPGRYRSTPLPGQAGNAAIAGHRTTYGAPFHRIDELEPGDEILVETIQGEFVYRVLEQEGGKGHFIVSPSAVEVLGQNFVEAPNRITLTACHPKYSARQRIIVVGELVGEPAQTPGVASTAGEDEVTEALPTEDVGGTDTAPVEGDNVDATTANATGDPTGTTAFLQDRTDSFGEGLNGDRAAIPGAVSWALAAGAIWLMAWFVGTKWRKWPMYGLLVTPFLIVLFMSFVHVDQALPSY